jgi:hypothetical protein
MINRDTIQTALRQNGLQAEEAVHIIEIEEKTAMQLAPVMRWVDANAIHRKTPRWITLLGGLGYCIGVGSTYLGYPLGENFAVILTKNGTDSGSQAFQIICGIVSFVPTAVLLGAVTRIEFQHWGDHLVKKPQAPSFLDNHPPYQRAMRGAVFLSSIAGAPFWGLLIPYFADSPVLSVLVPPSTMVSTYCASIGVSRGVLQNYFIPRYPEDSGTALLRKNLVARFKSAAASIRNKNQTAILSLYARLFILSGAEGSTPIACIKLLLSDCHQHGADNNQPESLSNATWAKITLDAFALTMGAVSNYVIFEPSIHSTNLLLNAIGINNTVFQLTFGILFGIGVLFMNALFDAMYSKYATDVMYKSWCEGQRLPETIALIAYFIAICASIPGADLAITEADNTLEASAVVPVFIGGTLARTLACDNLIRQVIMLAKNDPVALKRKNLINTVETLADGIATLPASLLIPLHAALQPARRREQRSQSFSTSVRNYAPGLFAAPRETHRVVTERRHSCPSLRG